MAAVTLKRERIGTGSCVHLAVQLDIRRYLENNNNLFFFLLFYLIFCVICSMFICMYTKAKLCLCVFFEQMYSYLILDI